MRRLSHGLCSLLVAVAVSAVVPAGSAGAQSSSAGVSAADVERFHLEVVTKPDPLSRASRLHVQGLRSQVGLRTDAAFLKRLHSYPERFHAVRSGVGGNLLVTPDELRSVGVALVSEPSTPELDMLESRVTEILGAADVNVFGTSTDVGTNHVVVMVGSRARAQRALTGLVPADAITYDVIPAPVPGPDDGNRRFGAAQSFDAVRTDGRRGLYVTFVGGPPVTDPDDPCQVDYQAFAIEHSGIVRLEVRPKRRFVGSKTGEPVVCTLKGYGRSVTVQLERPLGHRPLVDAATNEAVPVFDGSTLLRPMWLPPGWRKTSDSGWNSEIYGSVWGRTFGVRTAEEPTSCEAVPPRVYVSQGGRFPPGADRHPGSTVVDVVDVRGFPAERLVESRSGSTAILWEEPGGVVSVNGYATCADKPGVDLDTLTRIAQGLR